MKRLIWLFLCGLSLAQTTNFARMLAGVNNQTGAVYTFVAADATRVVVFNNAAGMAVTLPAASTLGFGAGSEFSMRNSGAGAVTVACPSCTINGAGTLTLLAGQSIDIYSDGANYVGNGGAGSVAAPLFITTPATPIAPNNGFGAGNIACSGLDPNIDIGDTGCGAVSNLFTFIAPTSATTFRHGWNYYFQADMTQTANPVGWAVDGGAEIPAAGQTATDIFTTQRSMSVMGGHATSAGTLARAGKIRLGIQGSTTLNGTLMGETVYLPLIASGSTLNGGLSGFNCDSPSVGGTFNGGYVCVNGGTLVGRSLTGGTANPALVINQIGSTVLDSLCWSNNVSAALIVTPNNCIYTAGGSPNGVLTAAVGSLYLDTTNGVSWMKNTGSGNTGWVQQVLTMGPAGTAGFWGQTITQPVAISANAGNVSGNNAIKMRLFFLPVATTVSGVAMQVTTATASCVLDVALYNLSGTGILNTNGSGFGGAGLACATTGVKFATFTRVNVPAGWYYLAWTATATTVSSLAYQILGQGNLTSQVGIAGAVNGYAFADSDAASAGILPSSITIAHLSGDVGSLDPPAVWFGS